MTTSNRLVRRPTQPLKSSLQLSLELSYLTSESSNLVNSSSLMRPSRHSSTSVAT
jgi:hypothetical protein